MPAGGPAVRGYVAVLTIHLHFPLAGSLKARRKEVAPVKAQLASRFGASVAEVGHREQWQRCTLLAALTAGDTARLDTAADAVEGWLLGRFPDGVRMERRLMSLEDMSD